MQLAHDAGLPSPRVLHVLTPQDELGTGFIMARVEGETIARKILRDEEVCRRRARCWRGSSARLLAGIHGLDLAQLPELRAHDGGEGDCRSRSGIPQFRAGRGRCSNWRCAGCATTIPVRPNEVTLVHGDFRHGNLIIGPDGVRAVLDWELAHIGDPMEDLGWICVNSWRFGEIDKPVGGFGTREELFAGYEAAGRRVDPARVKFWEVMGTLRWGVMCCGMMQRFRIGPEHSIERAMIGRRSSETEIDLLRLLGAAGELRCRTNRHRKN